MTNFDRRVRAKIRQGIRNGLPGLLNAAAVQHTTHWVLRKLTEEFVILDKVDVDSTQWEYRAVAREPDTGELYDSLGPFPSERAARDEADVQDLIRESDGSLPQLVLKIERRIKASAWEPLT